MSDTPPAERDVADLDPDLWHSVEVEVESIEASVDEQRGTKEKFWVSRSDDDRLWLFKFARSPGGITRGEDWAEWVVHKLGQVFGVPTATVVPAHVGNRRGVLSRNFVEYDERLVLGNSLLSDRDRSYDPNKKGVNELYTPASVRSVLQAVSAPDPALSHLSGFDVWAGYLILDALVAGSDRHDQNWGVVRTRSTRRLTPSFDHGTALGFQESDQRRLQLLGDQDLLSRWIGRGSSRHFAGKPALVAVAHDALRLASAEARQHWRERLAHVSDQHVAATVVSIPTEVMSDPARYLARALVRENRRRLLDGYPD